MCSALCKLMQDKLIECCNKAITCKKKIIVHIHNVVHIYINKYSYIAVYRRKKSRPTSFLYMEICYLLYCIIFSTQGKNEYNVEKKAKLIYLVWVVPISSLTLYFWWVDLLHPVVLYRWIEFFNFFWYPKLWSMPHAALGDALTKSRVCVI